GGDHSQKLLPRRGILLLSGAQTSGSLRIQHCSGKLRGGKLADATFPGPSQPRQWLSYRRPGSFWQADLGHFSRAPKDSFRKSTKKAAERPPFFLELL